MQLGGEYIGEFYGIRELVVPPDDHPQRRSATIHYDGA
jgi:hypothetical protein